MLTQFVALTCIALTTAPDEASEYIKAMEVARNKKDYSTMERVCREGVNKGIKNEYLVRSWSWSLCRLGRTEEGLKVARQNYQWNPCVWSVVNYIDAALDDGQVSDAKEVAKYLEANRKDWGQDEKVAKEAIVRASGKVFRLTWTVPTTRLKTGETLCLPVPMKTHNQQVVSWQATGVTDQQSGKDKYGNEYVLAKAVGDQPVTVTTDVKLSPFSVKELLSKSAGRTAPSDLSDFLKASPSRIKGSEIDPSDPTVVAVAKGFGGDKDLKAVEATMDWINASFTFCPPGSPPGADMPAEVIKRKGGHCEAITSVEVALLRAQQIPARMIRGQSAVRSDTGKSTQHTIVQFYLEKTGWVDWDYFLPRWKSRDDFVRLWVYNEIHEPGKVDQLADFFGRAFQELKGYKHQLITTTLD